MLTLFTTAKPFQGHIKTIQRNALQSWRLLHPDAEVILFGDEEGAAKACQELGLRHEAAVERSKRGAVRADAMFRSAQQLARNELLCYANCDIVLTEDFRIALQRTRRWRTNFLMVGRRWDTEVSERIDFSQPDWGAKLVELAKAEGIQRFYHNLDYFVFPRGFYDDMPPLVVGRVYWDQWMPWKALAKGAAVVDASQMVCAVHQNHDYGHLPNGWESVASDEDARSNFKLVGGHAHLRTIEDATFLLTSDGVVPNRFHWMAPAKRRARAVAKAVRGLVRNSVWHPLLDATRPMRHRAGLKKSAASASGKRKHHAD